MDKCRGEQVRLVTGWLRLINIDPQVLVEGGVPSLVTCLQLPSHTSLPTKHFAKPFDQKDQMLQMSLIKVREVTKKIICEKNVCPK